MLRIPAILWQAIVVEAGLLLVAWLLAFVFDLPGPSDIRLTRRGMLWGIAATAPLLAIMAWSLRTRAPSIARLRSHVESHIVPLFDGCAPAHLALIAILAGLGEETLFRGVIQAAATGALGTFPAIALTGILFGLCHPITRLYALLAALVGIYLGALYAATGELFAPVLTHALYDFIALMTLVGARRRRGGEPGATAREEPQGEPAIPRAEERSSGP